MHAPPPPVTDYLQDSGQQVQEPTQQIREEPVLKHTEMLHMLRVEGPVNLLHVLGLDVCFLAALCVGPAPLFCSN